MKLEFCMNLTILIDSLLKDRNNNMKFKVYIKEKQRYYNDNSWSWTNILIDGFGFQIPSAIYNYRNDSSIYQHLPLRLSGANIIKMDTRLLFLMVLDIDTFLDFEGNYFKPSNFSITNDFELFLSHFVSSCIRIFKSNFNGYDHDYFARTLGNKPPSDTSKFDMKILMNSIYGTMGKNYKPLYEIIYTEFEREYELFKKWGFNYDRFIKIEDEMMIEEGRL